MYFTSFSKNTQERMLMSVCVCVQAITFEAVDIDFFILGVGVHLDNI